ncbi:MAG: 6-bladed beta-propeller [bacterium]|nr:6-bladed beta-propeller [bacterium]
MNRSVRSISLTARSVRLMLVVALFAAAFAGPAVAGAWKGEEVTKEGVIHVMNPAEPANKQVVIDLEEAWRVGGEDDEELFGVITDIEADDDGNYYMLDSQLNEVKIYDGDGDHVRNIGREGEGPGEFRGAFNMFRVPGGNIGVLQAFPGKVVMLSPTGDPAGDYPLPEVTDAGFRMLLGAAYAGDNLALVYALNQPSESGFTQNNILSLVDKAGEKESRLVSQASKMEAATALISEKSWDTFRNGRWAAAPDGRAFAAPEYGEYKINVWTPDGKLARVIHREYPEHKRDEEQKQDILDIYKGFTRQIPLPNIKYEIEDSFNEIAAMFAREDGSLWVLTSRGSFGLDDGVVGVFDVFDKQGHFVKQVKLKGEGNPREDGYFFAKDRLFVVTDWLNALMALQGGGSEAAEEAEDEPELMQIISYPVEL